MTKRKIFLVKKILLTIVVLVVAGTSNTKGQKLYATGTVTGGLIGTSLLAGTPTGLSRIGTDFNVVGTLTTLGIPNSNLTNFYYLGSIRKTSGAPSGVGLNNFLGESEATPAVVQANKGLNALLIPLSGSSSFIQFRFSSAISGGSTTYFKLKEKPIRNSLLDVAALGALGLANSNIIYGEAFTNAKEPQDFPGSTIPLVLPTVDQNVGTPIGSASSPTKTDLLLNKNGEWYAAITPTSLSGYNSVRLTAQFPSDLNVLSLNNNIKFNVYNAFTEAQGNNCSVQPRYTNEGKATGVVTLNANTISSALLLNEIVKDPQYAIDDDENTYSSFSSGIANVGLLNSVAQSFYFDHKASAIDGVKLQLGIQASLINLELIKLNGIKFRAYNGISDIPVFEKGLADLTQLLGLNLLNLVTVNGTTQKKLDITFKPGLQFDRLEVVFERGLLGVDVLGDALRIYDVALAPSAPTITVQPSALNSTNVCEGSTASFLVTAVPSGGTISKYEWEYFDGNTWIVTGTNSSLLTINFTTMAMNNRLFRVKITGGNVSCPQTIVSTAVPLSVVPIPTLTLGTSVGACKGVTNAYLSYLTTSGNPITYDIVWSNSSLNNISNATLPPSPINITIPATAAAGTYFGNLTVKNANGCTSNNIPISIAVHPKPLTPHVAVQ